MLRKLAGYLGVSLIAGMLLMALLGAIDPLLGAELGVQSPIPLVVCLKPDGKVSGSAFRIGPHLLLSARHVAREAPCTIEGRPMRVLYASPNADFAELSDDRPALRFLRVDCGGFVAGRHYAALGHARGFDQITRVELIATGLHAGGMAILAGMFSPVAGQSGGPIVDSETGEAVGLVNASNYAAGLNVSVELAATPLCKKAAA